MTVDIHASGRGRGLQLSKYATKAVQVVALCVGAVALLFPIYWMVVTSMTSSSELVSFPPRIVPDFSQAGVYLDTLRETEIVRWLSNSAFIAFGTCITSIVLAFFAAYALSRFKFRGKGIFGFALFATQMLPEALLVVPFYALFIALGMLNNLFGLVIVNAAFVMPVVVWLLKGAIDGIPVEIEESARIDGASPFGIVTLVIAPLVAPSIAAGAIIAFFYGWDEFLLATTFITDESARPASVGLASFVGEYFIPVNQVMAASIIYTIPAIVFFVFVQRYVVSGLVAGSVKG